MNASPSIRIRLLAAGTVAAALVAGVAVAQTPAPSDPAPSTQTAPLTVPPGPQGAGPGMPGHHAGRGGHHDRAGRGERMFNLLDTDRDGKLSRAEFDAGQKAMMDRAQRAFDTADADRDGSLSATEQQAFRQAKHAQMPSQDGTQRRRGGAPAQPSAPVQSGS
jgi:hypothetical protein